MAYGQIEREAVVKTSLFRGALAVTLSAGLLMGWAPAIAFAEESEAAVVDVTDEELGEEVVETFEPDLSLREALEQPFEGEETSEGLTDEEINALVDEFVPGEGEYTDEDSLEEMAASFRDVTAKTSHRSEILKLKDWSISSGFQDGTFRPNATCKRGDMAAFICRAMRKMGYTVYLPTKFPAGYFSDVTLSTSHWKEIVWCYVVGISTGWYNSRTGMREFRPNANVKRGEMAAFMYRFAKCAIRAGEVRDYTYYKNYFADVKKNKTSFWKEILWMSATGASKGWTVRGKHYFRPNSYVKRGDMAFFLVKTMYWCW